MIYVDIELGNDTNSLTMNLIKQNHDRMPSVKAQHIR